MNETGPIPVLMELTLGEARGAVWEGGCKGEQMSNKHTPWENDSVEGGAED